MTVIQSVRDLWRSRLTLPNYAVAEAARYAGVRPTTVGRWHNCTLGKRLPGSKLSYLQLIELAVAASCRTAGMKLSDIRAAHAYFARAFQTDHPFATLKLKTDGVDLATEAGADLLIGNRNGQMAWNEIIGRRFRQFQYEDGLATRWHVAGEDSPVVIDPRIRFGAPQVAGVPTWLLKERWEAGELMDDIVEDLSLDKPKVEAALRFEGIDPTQSRGKKWPH